MWPVQQLLLQWNPSIVDSLGAAESVLIIGGVLISRVVLYAFLCSWDHAYNLNFRGVNISPFCQILLKNKFLQIKLVVKLPAMSCICYEHGISWKKIFTAVLRPAKFFNLETF